MYKVHFAWNKIKPYLRIISRLFISQVVSRSSTHLMLLASPGSRSLQDQVLSGIGSKPGSTFRSFTLEAPKSPKFWLLRSRFVSTFKCSDFWRLILLSKSNYFWPQLRLTLSVLCESYPWAFSGFSSFGIVIFSFLQLIIYCHLFASWRKSRVKTWFSTAVECNVTDARRTNKKGRCIKFHLF